MSPACARSWGPKGLDIPLRHEVSWPALGLISSPQMSCPPPAQRASCTVQTPSAAVTTVFCEDGGHGQGLHQGLHYHSVLWLNYRIKMTMNLEKTRTGRTLETLELTEEKV